LRLCTIKYNEIADERHEIVIAHLNSFSFSQMAAVFARDSDSD